MREGLIYAGTGSGNTAHLVNEDFFAAGLLQGIFLEIQALLMGGNPGISDTHVNGPINFVPIM
jgi:hypothetical protein